MKRSTKMLMMAGGNKRDQEYNRGYRMEYGPEDKFRDRRGREPSRKNLIFPYLSMCFRILCAVSCAIFSLFVRLSK